MGMIFKTNGFVHTDQPAHFVSETSFQLDKDLFSLAFEFFGSGKELLFHVEDPSGLLRVQHQSSRKPSNVLLHEDKTKSGIGTFPGKIQKGEWKIKVITYAARLNRMLGKVPFEVKVFEGNEDSESLVENGTCWVKSDNMEKGQIVLKEFEPKSSNSLDRRWLSGDFHVHSKLSDGSATNAELLEEGRSKELDFFFISEHNILTTGFPEKSGITVFPSYEVTTATGHFNALGLVYVPEGLLSEGPKPPWKALGKLIRNFKKKGVLISINHPFMEPWHWQYNDLPLSQIDSIEIITDPYDKNIGDANEKAVALMDILWNGGFRITGIGGSDTHTKYSDSQLGQPITRIYAKPGSLFSILEGIKKHRAQIFVDCDCHFTYMSERKVLLPGTDIGSVKDVPLAFSLFLEKESDPVHLCVIENGILVEEKEVLPGENCVIARVWKGGSDWIRCGLRDRYKRIRGYINPLHRGRKKTTIEKWGDALSLLKPHLWLG
jgi:hypothetical protein